MLNKVYKFFLNLIIYIKGEGIKMKKRVLVRHKIYNAILRYPVKLFGKIFFHYQTLKKYRIPKGESVIVLANHQSDFDPLWVTIGFNKPLYFVASDTLFSSGIGAKLLNHIFAPIPKKKGTVDPNCVKLILKTIREGGNIAIFPEGNRNYAEFQFPIDIGIVKLVKKAQKTLILYNLSGGNGVSPRFAKKRRKGKYYGYVKRELKPIEYNKYSDEELLKIIKDELRVYDSENKQLYKSKYRGEYLERMLFVCPNCGGVQTLYSKGSQVICSNCDLRVEFSENLHLKSTSDSFKFQVLNDWYQYQKQWCKNYQITDELIFEDDNIDLYTTKVGEKRKKIYRGNIKLYADKLVMNNLVINIDKIKNASVVSGRKFNFSTDENDYLVVGDERFNPLKYVLMFNRLDTYMKIHQIDEYYTLD